MRLLKIYFILLILSFSLGGCYKLLNPEKDNHYTTATLFKVPSYAEGLLMTAYARIPTNSLTFNDVATDDAVINNKNDQYLRMATGEWTSLYNPVSQWDNCLSSIVYINKFLTMIDDVPWRPSIPEINDMFKIRLRGEAYGLRGLHEYFLLLTNAGLGGNGQLLGYPIYTEDFAVGDNFTVTRGTFDDCVAQIYADFDKALTYLTMDDYVNLTSNAQLPPGLTNVNFSNYNVVFGLIDNQRISGRIIKALKARVALLAASPAYSPTSDPAKWQKAADYAGAAIKANGGIASLDPVGHRFFDATRIDAINLTGGVETKEMVWRRAKASARTRETNNFPPSLFGNGNVNPSQNLVDAFPMVDGYPITQSSAAKPYNPSNPYANRDPRLALDIVYNGSTMAGKIIKTSVGGGNNAKDSLPTSTRTGYYLKKLLREDVVVDPTAAVSKMHYEVHMRWTELFLIYAEAANEAFGPEGTGTNGFSARNVIAAIRKRANPALVTADPYLASITTQADMRTLIRNERRLELCFEGFRFWDLRRWKASLTETAKGVNINKAGTTYSVVDVETRAYNPSYMYYCPVPQKEVLKYSTLVQNQGW